MKLYLKKEIYFQISFEDGTDRSRVTTAFDSAIDPEFEKLVRKIKFHKEDVVALEKLVGIKVSIICLPKSDFLKQLNQKE